MNVMVRSLMVASVLAVSGCSSLLTSGEPVASIYTLLPAQNEAPAAGTGMARVVEIPPIAVPPGFDTERIALYMEDGHRIDYFSGAKWAAILDDVIQDFTRRTISNAIPYVVAVTPTLPINADFSLHVKVNEFQPVYSGSASDTPTLVTEVEFTLLALPDERIVSNFTLSRRGVASANNMDVIMAGLEKMLQEIEGEAFSRLEPYLKKEPL